MERYDLYKDSGVKWIGDIPSSFNLLPIKYILRDVVDNRGRTPELKEEGIPYVEVKHVNKNGKYPTENTDRFVSQDTYNSFLRDYLQEGDVLYTTVGTLGRTSIVPKNFNGCIIQNVVGFRTNDKCHSALLYYILNSEFGQHLIYDVVRGNILGSVKVTDFVQQKILIPPKYEQEHIVAYLDRKTTLIDSLIEKTVRKIELLKEKRTSLISEVVTKGLNPDVEMKDSGVEWIGEIPSHWIKGKWGYYYSSGMGSTILKEDLVEDGEVPVYSATKEDKIFGYINNPKLILNKGDIVIPARGTIGHVKLISSKSTTSQTTIYSKSKNEKIDSNYSYYYCKGNKINLFPFVQTAIPQITVSEVSFNPIILPPLSEQQQIVEYLDEQTQLIDKTISIEEKRIELLKEYRQSLISDVVTGKVKVTRDE